MSAHTDTDNHNLSYDNCLFNDSALNVKVTASPMYKSLTGMSHDSRTSVGSKNLISSKHSVNLHRSGGSKQLLVAKDGKYAFPDGAMFSGYMVDGIPHGYGVTRYGMWNLNIPNFISEIQNEFIFYCNHNHQRMAPPS